MARINENYQKLQAGYLFPEIGRRVRAFQESNPEAAVIRLGIGDVTLPLAPAVVEALKSAADEMGTAEGFRGYGPEHGAEDFLLDAILEQAVEGGLAPGAIVAPPGAGQELVRDVVARLDRNEYKRRQAPLVLRTSAKAFGSGRRLPIVHRYRGAGD